MDNVQIILAVFDDVQHQSYSDPFHQGSDPTWAPFWAYYVDETVSAFFPAPPNEPNDPDPYNGETGVDLNANLYWKGGDPNPGDDATYDVYFGTTNPPPLVTSNQSNEYYDPGTMDYETTYYWKIFSWDLHGGQTEGPIWHFTTASSPNQGPEAPTIDGPTSGKPNTIYMYEFSSTDPNDDDVYFYIDWGDGTFEEWIGPFDSEAAGSAQHSWNEKGTFLIKIKAKDVHGAESDWTTLEVEMPINKNSIHLPLIQFVQKVIQRFPILEKMFGFIQLLN